MSDVSGFSLSPPGARGQKFFCLVSQMLEAGTTSLGHRRVIPSRASNPCGRFQPNATAGIPQPTLSSLALKKDWSQIGPHFASISFWMSSASNEARGAIELASMYSLGP